MASVLIACPSPRDIKDFLKSVLKLPYDIYMAKYYYQPEAYIRIRNFFLKHHEYDTLCLIPDDLIVDKKGLAILVKDIDEYPSNVISGYCNFDADTYKHRYNFRLEGNRNYPEDSNFEDYLSKGRIKYVSNPYLYAVDFAGFGCMLIPREVVEKIPFTDRANHAGIDSMFCEHCKTIGVDVLVDIRAKFYHLAYRNKIGLESFYTGIKKSEELYITLK